VQLTQRIYNGIAAAEKTLKPVAVDRAVWTTHEILPPTNPVFEPAKLRELLTNKKNVAANRIRPAMTLGWIDRLENRTPIVLSALHLGGVSLLHCRPSALSNTSFALSKSVPAASSPPRLMAMAGRGTSRERGVSAGRLRGERCELLGRRGRHSH